MGDKKRKRQGEAAERPSKKAATNAISGTVRVEMIENKGVHGPILASTPGLTFPSNLTFDAYKASSRILPDGEVPSRLLLQTSAHPRLDYIAQEEKDGSSDSLLKDYIGVYDPATKKLQVMEVRKLTVRSTLRSEIDELRAEKERLAEARQTMTAKRHALASEFGSRKSKKAIDQMAQNAIVAGRAGAGDAAATDDPLSKTVLQGLSDTTSVMPSRADQMAAVNEGKPRPAANLAAEYPADVYPVEVLLGKDLLTTIEVRDWIEAAAAGQGVEVHSKYVAKRIFRLAKSKDVQKLKVLKFILLCINFHATLKGGPNGRAKKILDREPLLRALGTNVPPSIPDLLRKKFGSPANDMPRWYINNLITHIAAATLIVDDFEVDINDLRDDLKLLQKDMKQYFEEIGCRFRAMPETERSKLGISKAEAAGHVLARLVLPLKFPSLVRRGPR